MNNQNDENDIPLPSFSGNRMRMNISFNNDDEYDSGDETTRRVGGVCFAPMMHSIAQTSYVPPSLAPPSLGGLAPSTISTIGMKQGGGGTINTLGMKQVISTPTLSSTPLTWDLKVAPMVPPFGNPLEPTSVFVSYVDAHDISNTISRVLQERNIEVEYSKHEAECITSDHVEFSVFLYSGKEEYSHGIIVEVQRFNGNSSAFYEDCEAILDAVRDRNEPPRKRARTVSLLDDEDDEESNGDSLGFALKMLEGISDVQLLGLQTLSSMTNAGKIGSKTAEKTCSMLLRPGSKVLQKIFHIVNDAEEKSSLLTQALIVLSNVTNRNLRIPLKSISSKLLILLASEKQQMALLSAKCFVVVQVDSEVARALRTAQEFGRKKNNTQLVSVTSRLLRNFA